MKGKLIVRIEYKKMSVVYITFYILCISNIEKCVLTITVFAGVTHRTDAMQQVSRCLQTCTEHIGAIVIGHTTSDFHNEKIFVVISQDSITAVSIIEIIGLESL